MPAVCASPSLCVCINIFPSSPPPLTEPSGFLPSSKPLTLSQTQSAVFFLNKLKHNSLQRRKVRPPGPGFSLRTTAEGFFFFCYSFVLKDPSRLLDFLNVNHTELAVKNLFRSRDGEKFFLRYLFIYLFYFLFHHRKSCCLRNEEKTRGWEMKRA